VVLIEMDKKKVVSGGSKSAQQAFGVRFYESMKKVDFVSEGDGEERSFKMFYFKPIKAQVSGNDKYTKKQNVEVLSDGTVSVEMRFDLEPKGKLDGKEFANIYEYYKVCYMNSRINKNRRESS
jgi:hypothetical protein